MPPFLFGLGARLAGIDWRRLALATVLVIGAVLVVRGVAGLVREWRADVFAAGAASRQPEVDRLGRALAEVDATTIRLQLEDARRKLEAERRARQTAEEASHDYRARLADVDRRHRAALDRLRAGAGARPAPADPGDAGGAPVPGTAPPAGGADGAACADCVPVPLGWLLDAERQAAQLAALIAWAQAALAPPAGQPALPAGPPATTSR